MESMNEVNKISKSDLELLLEWVELKTSISDSTATMIIEKITEMIKIKAKKETTQLE